MRSVLAVFKNFRLQRLKQPLKLPSIQILLLQPVGARGIVEAQELSVVKIHYIWTQRKLKSGLIKNFKVTYLQPSTCAMVRLSVTICQAIGI